MIGIDLSFAVDVAFENVGNRENVHILQADLFQLPFPERNLRRHVLDQGVSTTRRTQGRPSTPWCLT